MKRTTIDIEKLNTQIKVMGLENRDDIDDSRRFKAEMISSCPYEFTGAATL